MRRFIKENWFKILIVLILAAIYFEIRTPKITDLFVGAPMISDTGDTVTIDGAWLPPIIDSVNRSPVGVMLTNTGINCYRAENLCKESRAIINNLGGKMNMQAWVFEYSIKEWGNEFIVASADFPVRKDELRINRKQKSATLIQTEKNSATAASQPFVWQLVGTDAAMKRFKELNKQF